MSDSIFDNILQFAKILNIDTCIDDIAQIAHEYELNEKDLQMLNSIFKHMADRKNEAVINTLLKMSRLPLKSPKTFENFDFSRLHGKLIDRLTSLPSLSAVYAHRNLAFIGPEGIGKTHLAMAYGYACCKHGLKTYFLKASELNQRLLDARKYDRVGSAMNFLVKPSCLIIDEIGRCIFDKENTRLFFDLIDRRYSKEGAGCMIFTSNRQPDTWREYFTEDSSLLCAMDRIFDEASVFIINGDGYRGQNLETIRLEAGTISSKTTK